MEEQTVKRVCLLLHVRKELLPEYVKCHDVWPEMLDAMHEAGIRNYSLFYRGDGLVVGCFEAENPQESLRKLGKTDVNRRWQKYMARFFESGSGDLEAGGPQWLTQYFFMA